MSPLTLSKRRYTGHSLQTHNPTLQKIPKIRLEGLKLNYKYKNNDSSLSGIYYVGYIVGMCIGIDKMGPLRWAS